MSDAHRIQDLVGFAGDLIVLIAFATIQGG
jgi:hypothetical protein